MSCLHYRIPASFRNVGMKANGYFTVNMFRGEKSGWSKWWLDASSVARSGHIMRWKLECWKWRTDLDSNVSGFLLAKSVRRPCLRGSRSF